MELIIAVKDNIMVRLELRRNVGPESLEIGCGSEDRAVVSAEVMRVNNCVSASGSDEVDDCREGCEVGGVEGGRHGALCQTLHKEWDSEDVHAFVHEDLD